MSVLNQLMKVHIPNSIIGLGAINSISETIKGFAPTKILVLSDEGLRKAGIIEKVTACLKSAGYPFDVYDKCETEPTISGIETLAHSIRAKHYDLLIGLGGGSVMDTTKVASLIAPNKGVNTYDLINGQKIGSTIRKILIPTTAGTGSEWSSSAVVSDDKAGKMTKLLSTQQNYADAVIIDPELTFNLPPRITADTGIDALTHCMEGYFGAKSNVLSDMVNGTALQLIADNLRSAYLQGAQNHKARFNMSIAAALAIHGGGLSGAPLAHVMNEPLGKRVQISHGTTCGLLLVPVMKFNFPSNPKKFAQIARMMGEDVHLLSELEAAARSTEAVYKLMKDVKMPTKLAEATDIELTETDISVMAEQVAKALPMLNSTNTRPVTLSDVTQIYRHAIWGENSSNYPQNQT